MCSGLFRPHPSAQVALLTTGILIAFGIAWHVSEQQRAIEDERERRLRVWIAAQDAYRAQIHSDIRKGRA